MIQLDDEVRVIQDVETRWWSTFAIILRLLYPEVAIKLHERLDNIYAVLRLLKPVTDPVMGVQKLLNGEKYVASSVGVPHIYDLRARLNN